VEAASKEAGQPEAMAMSEATDCAACRRPLPLDARFCGTCGSSRPTDPTAPIGVRLIRAHRRWRRSVLRALTLRDPRLCFTCWSQVPADCAFCFRCGADLAVIPPAPPATPVRTAYPRGDVGWWTAADALGHADLPDVAGEAGDAIGSLLDGIGNMLGGGFG
jgi:hypothetical protein